MNIMYYVLSAVLMGICFCVGVLTEKHFADKGINYEISSYFSGEEVINEHDKSIDLLFLDLVLS